MDKDIKRETFIETNEQYGNGICLSDYKNTISLCNANPGEENKIWLDWIFPQGQDRKPITKSLPWKITLGNVSTAVSRLRSLADKLETIYAATGPATERNIEQPDAQDTDPKDMPF